MFWLLLTLGESDADDGPLVHLRVLLKPVTELQHLCVNLVQLALHNLQGQCTQQCDAQMFFFFWGGGVQLIFKGTELGPPDSLDLLELLKHNFLLALLCFLQAKNPLHCPPSCFS